MGIRPELVILPVFFIIVYAIPILVGFIWIRVDAARLGQPGMLWAVLTIPFGWTAVIVYLVVRAVRTPSQQR